MKENNILTEKLNGFEKFMDLKEIEFNEIVIKKDKEIKEIQSTLKNILKDYEDKFKSLHNSNEFYKSKLRDNNQNNSNDIKKYIKIIKEKDDMLFKLKIKLEEMEKLKKNCFKIVEEMNF
jgi:hypothetical protein